MCEWELRREWEIIVKIKSVANPMERIDKTYSKFQGTEGVTNNRKRRWADKRNVASEKKILHIMLQIA